MVADKADFVFVGSGVGMPGSLGSLEMRLGTDHTAKGPLLSSDGQLVQVPTNRLRSFLTGHVSGIAGVYAMKEVAMLHDDLKETAERGYTLGNAQKAYDAHLAKRGVWKVDESDHGHAAVSYSTT